MTAGSSDGGSDPRRTRGETAPSAQVVPRWTSPGRQPHCPGTPYPHRPLAVRCLRSPWLGPGWPWCPLQPCRPGGPLWGRWRAVSCSGLAVSCSVGESCSGLGVGAALTDSDWYWRTAAGCVGSRPQTHRRPRLYEIRCPSHQTSSA